MSEFITGTTFGGSEWTPAYVSDLNQRNCIGCGRCFKVCLGMSLIWLIVKKLWQMKNSMTIMAILKMTITPWS